MTPELVGVIGLVAIFAISMWRKINMGAVALVVAFLLGTFYFQVDAKDISAGFPGNLLVTLVGVTFFFGLARANGTVNKVVDGAVSLVSGRAALIPWVFFLLAAVITGSGAISAATNAILIPVGLAFATRYRINPVLIGLSIINGTNAGGFSPLAVYFSIVNGVLKGEGIQIDPGTIFVVTFLFNLALNVVVFFIFGGRKLFGARDTAAKAAASAEAKSAWTVRNTVTIILFALILIGGLFFGLDVGFLALSAAVILGCLWPKDVKEGMEGIGWGVVLLIGGIITYIARPPGGWHRRRDCPNSVIGVGSALVAGLLMMYIAGVVSAFASTNAMFRCPGSLGRASPRRRRTAGPRVHSGTVCSRFGGRLLTFLDWRCTRGRELRRRQTRQRIQGAHGLGHVHGRDHSGRCMGDLPSALTRAKRQVRRAQHPVTLPQRNVSGVSETAPFVPPRPRWVTVTSHLLLGAAVLIITGVPPVGAALDLATSTGPVLLLVIALTIVAELASAAGAFTVIAEQLAVWGPGRMVVLGVSCWSWSL
jgi:Na+/H+ antiporter NhaD/arsenite permease-like protein